MDILKMLSELRSERSQLEEAIIVFERLATGQRKGRGRPPKWMSEARDRHPTQTKARKKPRVSPEVRKLTAAAQRKRSAAAKKL